MDSAPSKGSMQDVRQANTEPRPAVSSETLRDAIDKLGNAPATVRTERKMSNEDKPLKPDDFPVNAEGKKIRKQDGTSIAETKDPAVAADVAERLNEDEARREEDKWSA
jgi:hypothetical protein